ncbi:Transcription initiation protein spt3 [Malassezia psittaci]|uniref:Transcription initiation protein spt3 n=1 Tax=Malassezia psittaci TaxID=1821823 RepID=A0AAF0FAU9_9BASI|nr:Transcription initiation protein spt3 [Malassezia psittaci]
MPEDLIFLIRYDRAKVNRLRTYLSWKDVRKNAKDSGGDASGGPSSAADAGDGIEDTVVDGPLRTNKRKMKLPWELPAIFFDYPRVANPSGGEEAEEEDEDTIETNEDSLRRLKAADETTRRMTRDEYVFYSECRQASFTFRKAKRFREFIHSNLYLDVKPSDDTIDILGFLAYEVVHELCTSAMRIKCEWEERAQSVQARTNRSFEHSNSDKELTRENNVEEAACTLFSLPPSAKPPLEPWHIREAFAQFQRDQRLLETGRRTAGPTGGLRRTNVFVI